MGARARGKILARPPYWLRGVVEGTTVAIVDVLRANGWDIDRRMKNGNQGDAQPLLWFLVGDRDKVVWALDKGATVLPKDFEESPHPDMRFVGSDESDDWGFTAKVLSDDHHNCWSVLERAAEFAAVATSEHLRLRGAPFGLQCLHNAVNSATFAYARESQLQQQNRAVRQPPPQHLADTYVDLFYHDVVVC